MNRNLSEFQRNAIVILRNSGKSWQEIAEELRERYNKTVTKRGMQYLWKKYKETGTIRDKTRSGRPVILSPQGSRVIERICKRNRLLSVKSITRMYNTDVVRHVSVSTVQKILIKYGLRSYTAVQKPFLKSSQRLRRVAWAKDYMTWDTAKWGAVVFSDECVIQSYSSIRKVKIRRTASERCNPTLIQPVMRHGPKIHVWGCLTSNGVGLLKRIKGNMNAEKYQNEVINDIDIVGKCLVFPEQAFIFQQDLAPPHKAKSTHDFFKNKNIDVLPWPGNSPDINPIENVWGILKRNLTSLQINSTEALWIAVQEEWYKLSPNLCKNLIYSMPKRLQMVNKAKGYPIKY